MFEYQFNIKTLLHIEFLEILKHIKKLTKKNSRMRLERLDIIIK